MAVVDTTPIILSLEEYVANPMGGPTPRTDRTLTEAEVYRTLQYATRKVNEFLWGQILLDTIVDEPHKYRQNPDSGAMEIRLYRKPIRHVVNMSFVMGQFFGGRIPAPVLTTPVEVGVAAPVIEGNIVIDRNANIIRIFSPLVVYAPGAYMNPFTYQSAARVVVTYTAGFDDGTVQADGVAIPYPYWLKDVVHATVVKWLLQRRRSRAGRGLAGTYRLGNVGEKYKDDIDLELSQGAKDTLNRQFQNWQMA